MGVLVSLKGWNEANRPHTKYSIILTNGSAFFKYKLKKEVWFMDTNKEPAKEQRYIYRPWITVNGVRIYAAAYGKKAFKIPVADK